MASGSGWGGKSSGKNKKSNTKKTGTSKAKTRRNAYKYGDLPF